MQFGLCNESGKLSPFTSSGIINIVFDATPETLRAVENRSRIVGPLTEVIMLRSFLIELRTKNFQLWIHILDDEIGIMFHLESLISGILCPAGMLPSISSKI